MLKYILIFLIIFMLFYKYKIEKFDKERYSCGCSRNSCIIKNPKTVILYSVANGIIL